MSAGLFSRRATRLALTSMRSPAVQALLDLFPGAKVRGEPEPTVNRCAICGEPCGGETCRQPCVMLYEGFRFAMNRKEAA